MAVVGPSRHTRFSMSVMQGSSATVSNNNNSGNGSTTSNNNLNSSNCNITNNNQQTVTSVPQNYYQTQSAHQSSASLTQAHHFPSDIQADRPIGYGAFGVVW